MKKKRELIQNHIKYSQNHTHTHTHEVMNTTVNGSNQTIYKYI